MNELCFAVRYVLIARKPDYPVWVSAAISGGFGVQVVEEKAQRTPGKKSLAIEAYARALRAIPGTICDNAGKLCRHPSSGHHEAVLQHPHAAS